MAKQNTISPQLTNDVENITKDEIRSNMDYVIKNLQLKGSRMRRIPSNVWKLKCMALLPYLYEIGTIYLQENIELDHASYDAKTLYKKYKRAFDIPDEDALTREKMSELRRTGMVLDFNEPGIPGNEKFETDVKRIRCSDGIMENVYTFTSMEGDILRFRARDVFYMIWKMESMAKLKMRQRIIWYAQPQSKVICNYTCEFSTPKMMDIEFKIIKDCLKEVRNKYHKFHEQNPGVKSIITTFAPSSNKLTSSYNTGMLISENNARVSENFMTGIDLPTYILTPDDIRHLHGRCEVSLLRSDLDNSLILEISNENGRRIFSNTIMHP